MKLGCNLSMTVYLCYPGVFYRFDASIEVRGRKRLDVVVSKRYGE